ERTGRASAAARTASRRFARPLALAATIATYGPRRGRQKLGPRVEVEHDLADRAARPVGIDEHQAEREAAARKRERVDLGRGGHAERAGAPRRLGAPQRAGKAPLDR